MDNQDWTPVTVRRRYSKKEAAQSGQGSIQVKDPAKNEKIRMAKLANIDCPGSKKCINPTSLQSLIKSRIELKVTQENADNMCAFPRNTFKNIESNRTIPSDEQKRSIQQHFNVYLKTFINEI